jgi:hypothetical protein
MYRTSDRMLSDDEAFRTKRSLDGDRTRPKRRSTFAAAAVHSSSVGRFSGKLAGWKVFEVHTRWGADDSEGRRFEAQKKAFLSIGDEYMAMETREERAYLIYTRVFTMPRRGIWRVSSLRACCNVTKGKSGSWSQVQANVHVVRHTSQATCATAKNVGICVLTQLPEPSSVPSYLGG